MKLGVKIPCDMHITTIVLVRLLSLIDTVTKCTKGDQNNADINRTINMCANFRGKLLLQKI